MVDHVAQCIEALLDREVELVVHGVDMLGDVASRAEIGGTLQADGERVQPWPPCLGAVVLLDAARRETTRDGRHDR